MLIEKLYHHPIISAVFPTLEYCLKRELACCESVLDIGCGPSSPLRHIENIRYSVGVEPFLPYLEKAKELETHTEYIGERIEELNFRERSFDTVIMIELIEHLPREIALGILKKAKGWARKKVILSTPNGFLPQGEADGNPWQNHRSGWTVKDLRQLGYNCHGLAGFKFLRRENQEESMEDGSLFSSIKFWPHPFWFGVATLSQMVTYRFPELAFEIFAVKDV